MKKRLFSLLSLILVLTLLVGCGARGGEKKPEGGDKASTETKTDGSASYTIRLGHSASDSHPYQIGLEHFKKLVEEKTEGDVVIELFPNSTLGGERDMLEGLQIGTLEATMVSTAPLAGYTDAFLPLDLPYMFKDKEAARAALDSEVGDEILASLEDIGMVGVTFYENGIRHLTNSARPIKTPDDVKGLKIRVMENEIMMDSISAWGGDPTPMAFNELYTGLQQGTIDGQENPTGQIYTMKFYEAQKYMSMSGHFYSPAPLIMAKSYWDKLPEEYQTIIKEAADESKKVEREALDKMDEEQLKEMKDFGLEVNDDVDKDAFLEKAQSVYDKHVGEGKKIPQDIVDRLKSFNK